jgi:hypothetical protein
MADALRPRLISTSCLAVLIAAAALRAQAPASCVPEGGVQFVCGLDGPEDLVVLPGEQWVVASAYTGRGGIYLIRARDRAVVLAYPTDRPLERFDAKTYGRCPGPPDAATRATFRTHGLSLRPQAGGVHRLFAVLHGGRESVEVFELDARVPIPTITWIGCAVAPDPIGLNSVRALADGGFVATNFLARPGSGGPPIERVMTGEVNGELWEWRPASGWRKVPGSEAAGANGLELSADERTIYAAAWGSQSVFRLSRASAVSGRRDVPLGFRADNVRWARDGSILIAGQGEAPASSLVITVDPVTLAVKQLRRHPDTPSFGAATVAVEVGRELWLGSFRGDRVAILP